VERTRPKTRWRWILLGQPAVVGIVFVRYQAAFRWTLEVMSVCGFSVSTRRIF
jgi:hypothetical protein